MSKDKLTIKQEAFCQAYVRLGEVNSSASESEYDFKDSYGSKYYVYLLVNPIDDSIFYVGKGKGKRAENYLTENKKGNISNAKKHSVINEIVSIGLEPIILIFENELEEQKLIIN